MKIFFVESYIVFNMVETISDNLNICDYLNINLFEMVEFSHKKVVWSNFTKKLYYRRELPYYFLIHVNDRFNWVYRENAWLISTSTVCLFNINYLFENSLKHYSTIKNIVMSYESLVSGHTIYIPLSYMYAYIVEDLLYYKPLYECVAFSEGYSWLCQLDAFTYTCFENKDIYYIKLNYIFGFFVFTFFYLYHFLFKVIFFLEKLILIFFSFLLLLLSVYYYRFTKHYHYHFSNIYNYFFEVFRQYSASKFSKLFLVDLNIFMFNIKMKRIDGKLATRLSLVTHTFNDTSFLILFLRHFI